MCQAILDQCVIFDMHADGPPATPGLQLASISLSHPSEQPFFEPPYGFIEKCRANMSLTT